MSVKLKDIAVVAGVSESTVSLALNEKPVVRHETRDRIKAIAAQLGYSPNLIAKSLARSKSGTIGLVVPDIENPFFSKLIRCIDEDLLSRQINLIVATSGDRLEGEQRVIDNFISERVEGVIIAPVNQAVTDPDYIRKLESNKIRFVFATSYYPNIPAPFVMTDLEQGSFELTEHLIRQDRRRIFFLVGDRSSIPTMTRIKGYTRACEAHHLDVDDRQFIPCGQAGFEQAYRATLELLGSGCLVDAVITLNDIMALGALRALSELRIRIPGQIALAGYDNVVFSSVATIPITTVQQDMPALAAAAVDILLGQSGENTGQNRQLFLPPRLIVRESTGPREMS